MESFYVNQWREWDERFSTKGYKTSSTFVWIRPSREGTGKNTNSAGKTREEAVDVPMRTRTAARKAEEQLRLRPSIRASTLALSP